MISEASITGLLRTILIVALAYYAVKVLFRLTSAAWTWYLRSGMKGGSSGMNAKKEKPEHPKKDDLGTYVDYEETKD